MSRRTFTIEFVVARKATIAATVAFLVGGGLARAPVRAPPAQARAPTAQVPAPVPQVGTTVHVSSDRPREPHVEPHLDANPSDPRVLYAASMVAGRDGISVDAFISRDGGGTWSRFRVPDCGFDPWLTVASDGTPYLSCLAGKDALVYVAEVTGDSWTLRARVRSGAAGALDHTSLVIESVGQRSRVSIVGMQDTEIEGERYVAPFVSPIEGAPDSIARSRLVMSNVWANTMSAVSVRSRLVLAFVDFSVDGRKPLNTLRMWSARSRDHGATFSIPSLIAELDESSTIPVLVAGGPREDAYVVFDDVRDGKSGVWLVRSQDAGFSWSDPTAVSITADPTKRHFNAQAAVDGEGTVLAAWYESDDDGSGRCFHVALAASIDGGESFGPAVLLSSEPFCVDGPGNHVEREDGTSWNVARRWPYGGDYFGLVAREPGLFQMLWADSRTGAYQLWSAAIRVPRGIDGEGAGDI